MQSQPSRCVFKCKTGRVHTFPNPHKEPDRFNAWITNVNRCINKDQNLVYKCYRICDKHFETKYKLGQYYLTKDAVPTLFLSDLEDLPPAQIISDQVAQEHLYAFTRVDPPLSMQLPCTLKRKITDPVKSTLGTDIGSPVFDKSKCARTYGSKLSRKEDEPTTVNIKMNEAQTNIIHKAKEIFSAADIVQAKKSENKQKSPKIFLEKPTRSMLRETSMLKKKIKRLRRTATSFRKKLVTSTKLTKQLSQNEERLTLFSKLFQSMQKQGKNRPKGRRYTDDEKIMCLSLYKQGPKAYRFLAKQCILPSARSLNKLLGKFEVSCGIDDKIMASLKTKVQKLPQSHRLCTLMFDEMYLAPHLDVDEKHDVVVGFEELGYKRTSKFANHVLVLMVRGIKRKFKQPIAFYFCNSSTKTPDLVRILQEAIKAIHSTGLTVVATVCDQGSTNAAAINSLIKTTRGNYLRKNTEMRGRFFEVDGSKIIPIFDPPHLLKGIRNSLLNYDLQFVIDGRKLTAKWEHIEMLKKLDTGNDDIKLLPKLTDYHAFRNKIPKIKMRVKHAAQVMSRSVSATMRFLAKKGVLPSEAEETAELLLLFDKIFDSVNAAFSEPVKGKIYRTAVTGKSIHHDFWKKALVILKSMSFVDENGLKVSIPSLTNWIKTIEGFQDLWKVLHNEHGITSLLTRHINQDAVENFFGSIRSHGLRNTKPSCSGFIGAYKTLLLNNLTSNHSVGSNCEDDSQVCLQNMKSLLLNNSAISKPSSSNYEVTQMFNQNKAMSFSELAANADNYKIHGISYISGFICKKTRSKVFKKCRVCADNLIDKNSNVPFHDYIKCREYTDDKKWLCYPSRELCECITEMHNSLQFVLKTEFHLNDLKLRLNTALDLNVDYDFIQCEKHRSRIINFINSLTIRILIYNRAKELNRIMNGMLSYEDDDNDPLKRQALETYIKTRKK